MKEIDELVEKVAEDMSKFDCSFTGNKECDGCEQTEHNYFHCVAKQILFGNNLAIITSKLPDKWTGIPLSNTIESELMWAIPLEEK